MAAMLTHPGHVAGAESSGRHRKRVQADRACTHQAGPRGGQVKRAEAVGVHPGGDEARGGSAEDSRGPGHV
jgi:hypothetical protein